MNKDIKKETIASIKQITIIAISGLIGYIIGYTAIILIFGR